MDIYKRFHVLFIVLWSFVQIPESQSQETVPKYKLRSWRIDDQVASFSDISSTNLPLYPSKQKLVIGKPKKAHASLTLPSSVASTAVSPPTGSISDEVNKLVDKTSSASASQPSNQPKVKQRKGGPPHYPPINRKALYATGLIYLRDFRPGSPLY